jgi:hypothetical protein
MTAAHCTPGRHTCTALALAVLGQDAMAAQAVAQCEALMAWGALQTLCDAPDDGPLFALTPPAAAPRNNAPPHC